MWEPSDSSGCSSAAILRTTSRADQIWRLSRKASSRLVPELSYNPDETESGQKTARTRKKILGLSARVDGNRMGYSYVDTGLQPRAQRQENRPGLAILTIHGVKTRNRSRQAIHRGVRGSILAWRAVAGGGLVFFFFFFSSTACKQAGRTLRRLHLNPRTPNGGAVTRCPYGRPGRTLHACTDEVGARLARAVMRS